MTQSFHNPDLGKLILRIAVASLMLFHGIYKVTHGIDWMLPLLAEFSLPGFVAYGVFVAEILAPILLVLGVLTRPAGLVIAFDMVMAIALALRDKIFTLKESGGGWAIELEVFFLFAGLALFFLGAGKYSASQGKGTWD